MLPLETMTSFPRRKKRETCEREIIRMTASWSKSHHQHYELKVIESLLDSSSFAIVYIGTNAVLIAISEFVNV